MEVFQAWKICGDSYQLYLTVHLLKDADLLSMSLEKSPDPAGIKRRQNRPGLRLEEPWPQTFPALKEDRSQCPS